MAGASKPGAFTNTIELRHAYSLQFSSTPIFPEAAAYLESAQPENWAFYLLHGAGVALFGLRTSNFSESANASILPLRFTTPYTFMTKLFEQQSGLRYTRQIEADKWASQNLIISPPIMAIYQSQVGKRYSAANTCFGSSLSLIRLLCIQLASS
jgi:hypothetical protein